MYIKRSVIMRFFSMDPDDRVVMELQCSKENKKGNFRILTITGLKLQFPKMNFFFIHLCNLF